MEANQLTSEEFWLDEVSVVMANPRDERAVNEAKKIQKWLDCRDDLSGHMLFSTSGSTGGFKWVALSKKALLISATAVNSHLGVGSHDRWLLALPTFHVGGLGICARAYVSGCAVSDFFGRWDVGRFVGQLTREKITLVSLVPTQLVDLVGAEIQAPTCLKAVLIGGGRLDDAFYDQAMKLGWPVVETFGMTETSSQIATAEYGSRELRLLPIWNAQLNANRQLQVRGAALMSGYVALKNGDVSVSNVLSHGWFQTDDLVELNHDVIRVMGRSDRCVKVLGELVDLDQVAHEFKKHITIDDELVVVPVNDERRGCLLIVCMESEVFNQSELDQFNLICNPLYRIEKSSMIAAFPRSPLGKIQYARLREKVIEILDN